MSLICCWFVVLGAVEMIGEVTRLIRIPVDVAAASVVPFAASRYAATLDRMTWLAPPLVLDRDCCV